MTVDRREPGGFSRPPLRSTLRRAARLLRDGDLAGFVRRLGRYLRRTADRRQPPTYAEWRAGHVTLSAEDRAVVTAWNHDLPEEACTVVASHRLSKPADLGPDGGLTLVVDEATLHDGARMAFTLAAERNPSALVFSADHEIVDVDGHPVAVHLKPGWNRDLALGSAYAGPVLAIRNGHLAGILDGGPPSSFHDLLLRAADGLEEHRIAHVPTVLSSTTTPWPVSDPTAVARAAGLPRDAITVDERSGACRVAWPMPDPLPMVSIVIPTKDRGRMLRRCVDGVLHRTSYPDLEVVIVDHASTQRSAKRFIDGLARSGHAEVVEFSGEFNFSRMVNLGVAASRGQVVCLLNNDTEVIDPDWLTELVRQVLRPEVGAVGGLLLFPDGTIQHAGVHPGLGGFMGHGHKHRRHDDPGYHGRLTVAHQVAAVTGACLATRREAWDGVGGMDEELPVAFNDVDLCLRIRQVGLHVLFTPHSILRHHESASRGADDDPERSARLATEHRRMVERWGSLLDVDPAYHPDLSRDPSGFSLAETPTTVPPWRQETQEPTTEA